jgi:cytochrome b561
MPLYNTETSWGAIARFLHWTMAGLIVGMLIFGTIMVDWPDGELQTKFALYQWHKSFGFVVLGLLVVRALWRWSQPVPPLPAGSTRFTRRASALSHGGLYALMLVLPVTGYLMSSTNTLGVPTQIFGVVEVPHLLGPDAQLEAVFKTMHAWAATALMLLVALHVLAALKHAVVNRDGVWTRMVRDPHAAADMS